MKCPSCSSEGSSYKLRAVYESGTSIINQSGTSYGAGFANDGDFNPDGFGAMRTSSQGMSQTMLAKKCSPPEKRDYMFGYAILIGCILIVFGFCFNKTVESELSQKVAIFFYIIGGILATVVAFILYKVDVASIAEYKKKRLKWNNSWICLRCGQVWFYE